MDLSILVTEESYPNNYSSNIKPNFLYQPIIPLSNITPLILRIFHIGLPIIFMVNLQQGILFINTQRSSARRNRSASWWSLGVQGFFRGTRGSRKRWKPGLTWKITSDLIVKGTKETRRIYYIHRKNNNLN
jgi:hypothetical protein